MIASRLFVALALVALLAACTPSTTARPAATEPVSEAPGSGVALDCQPIDLRAPTGEGVDLTGEWAGTGELAQSIERAWLNQSGDCVNGAVLGGAFVSEAELGASLTNLSGRIGSDFRIEFDVVMVFQDARFAYGEQSRMVMLIEWDDDGRMRLREDRAPGETAGRCTQSQFDCPAPVIWYRLDDSPPL
jgi:hypothetical protein